MSSCFWDQPPKHNQASRASKIHKLPCSGRYFLGRFLGILPSSIRIHWVPLTVSSTKGGQWGMKTRTQPTVRVSNVANVGKTTAGVTGCVGKSIYDCYYYRHYSYYDYMTILYMLWVICYCMKCFDMYWDLWICGPLLIRHHIWQEVEHTIGLVVGMFELACSKNNAAPCKRKIAVV